MKNKKPLVIVLILVAAAVGGWLWYSNSQKGAMDGMMTEEMDGMPETLVDDMDEGMTDDMGEMDDEGASDESMDDGADGM